MTASKLDINSIHPRGRAVWRHVGTQHQLRASHALAALRLIAKTGGLEIHLTPGEAARLEHAPRQIIRQTVADLQPTTLAQCAYTVLQNIPERKSSPHLKWIVILATGLSILTFILLDSINHTHLIHYWLRAGKP